MKLHFPVGIEIETAAGDTQVSRTLMPHSFEAGTDPTARYGSREGLEFRSIKIEDSDVLLTDLPKACRTIRNAGCLVHNKCGLHVHIGFKQIGDLSAKYRLFRFMSCYEKLFFELLPPWPERATYCVKLRPAIWESFQRGEGFNYWLDTKAAQSSDSSRSSHYWWFNGAAMFKHGTVEFRHMNGTLDHDEILGWVAILQCIFHATTNLFVKLDWCNTRVTPTTLIRDMKANDNEFWGQRASNFILAKAERH